MRMFGTATPIIFGRMVDNMNSDSIEMISHMRHQTHGASEINRQKHNNDVEEMIGHIYKGAGV